MIRLLLLAALLQTSVAYGQSNRDEEARGLYLAGQAAYEAGRYGDALVRFDESYALSARPELLYNMGHAAQLDGQLARAIDAFERYMEEAPHGQNREGLEERVETLRVRLAAEESRTDPDGEATPRVAPVQTNAPIRELPEVEEPDHTLALTLGIGGAAFVAGGGVMLGLMAGQQSNVENAEDGTPWSEVQGNHNRARTYRTVGISLLSAGAILAGVGLSLWLAQRTQVSVSAQGVHVSGSF